MNICLCKLICTLLHLGFSPSTFASLLDSMIVLECYAFRDDCKRSMRNAVAVRMTDFLGQCNSVQVRFHRGRFQVHGHALHAGFRVMFHGTD